MTNETISDIVREMREHASGDATETYYDRFAWSILCDRIEAAAKRDVEDTQVLVEDNRQLAVDLDAMKAENDRLCAALKPVLDIKISEYDTDYETGIIASGNTFDAVREAQSIYKEGDNND